MFASKETLDGSRSLGVRSGVAVALGTGAFLFGSAALAQAQAQAEAKAEVLMEVTVTGSRIRGVEPTGSKVIALDRDQIIETGAPSTADLIRQLPQIVGLGASETASGAQNGAANVTRGIAVNLRGIGSNATLLLLGGRRMPPAGTQGQFTDASVIPAIAVERLEVVADGGSAIYGSDAITGVVNLVPRRDFEGAESSARYGMADGYYDWSVGQIGGLKWQSGHVTAAIEYAVHSALDGADRDFYTSDLRSAGGTDLRSQQCAPGTILVGGVPYAIPANSTGTNLTPASFTPNTRNLCDNLKRGEIIPDLRRTNAFVSAEQELSDSISLFAEGFFSRRTFTLRDSQVTSNLNVTTANPFYVNPTGGTGPVTVQYDFANDGGLPDNPGEAQSWEAVFGTRFALGGDWKAEAYVSYGRSEDEVRRTHNLNTTPGGINAALANPDPAQAFNPFGSGGISNAATVAAVRNGLFVIQGDTDLTVASMQADGALFALPGGDVRLAIGAEYRDEGLGGDLTSGSVVAPVHVPSKISRNVAAVFTEAFVPIFRQAGGQELDLSLAGRYEDYSDFGDTFNPKIGLNWRPMSAVTFRGSWGTSFRAPGLAENDPHSGGYGLYGDTLPCSHRAPATTCFGIGIAGGNPDVKAEEATTWSTGFEIAPESLPDLRVSATYFNIDYKNQILALRGTAGLLTNNIYAPYRILDPTAQQVADLLASGLPVNSPINAALVTYIQDGRRQNLGKTIAKGIDFAVSDAWPLGTGKLRAGVNATYFTHLTAASAPGAADVDVLNTLNFPQRFRARGELGWRGEKLSALAFVNYTSGYDQTGVTPIRSIDSYTTVDLHVGYDLGALSEGLSMAIDVQNAADSDPPFVNIAGGYDPQSASPLGRLVALSLRKSW
ncbi:TonB-dependent receptor plug domain-containing protein [Povalibacter sp.]|uniref:TonB-dependent receptor plug domain-containing protein n=1 Tax=Povalibacter sp. TaxID=1962978 RepID=UPI002F415A99